MAFETTEALRDYIEDGVPIHIDAAPLWGTYVVTDSDAPITQRQTLFDDDAWAFEFEDDAGLFTTYRYVHVEPNRFGGDGAVSIYRVRKNGGTKEYAQPRGHIAATLDDFSIPPDAAQDD